MKKESEDIKEFHKLCKLAEEYRKNNLHITNNLYNEKLNSIKTNSINLSILNNLNLKKVDSNKFSTIKILKKKSALKNGNQIS